MTLFFKFRHLHQSVTYTGDSWEGSHNLPKKKRKIRFIVCRWVWLDSKHQRLLDMKTVSLDDTEKKPVRGIRSITPCCWVWRKVNYEFPGIALYQYIQLVKQSGEGADTGIWPRVDEEHQGSGFDHRWCVSASKWPRLSAGVSARLFQHGPTECVRYSVSR